jgi:hypothetical protein
MSGINDAIEAASRLPLMDAAFMLWQKKRDLDRVEFPDRQPSMKGADTRDPGVLKRVVRMVIQTMDHERVTAADGPTFDA